MRKGVLSSMTEALIEVRNLSKSFDGRVVLDGINFTVERGSVFAIMGGSGCGKTTLLRHLIGVVPPDSGQILVGGQDITLFDENLMDGYRRRFGMLFQMGALLNSLSVHDNIALPLREHTELDERIIGVMVKMKLELVGLRDFEHLKPAQLSGGMQKRVALARALALDPEIVFYDEPTSGSRPCGDRGYQPAYCRCEQTNGDHIGGGYSRYRQRLQNSRQNGSSVSGKGSRRGHAERHTAVLRSAGSAVHPWKPRRPHSASPVQ